MANGEREVVVTGLGVVCPLGNDVETFWETLAAGRHAVRPVTLFDAEHYRIRIAQTVPGAERARQDPAVCFALEAAQQAISQAGLPGKALRSAGLALATTAAGWTHGQRLYSAHLGEDDAAFEELAARPELLLKEALPSAIAARFGITGPSVLLSPACAAASSAIAWAAQRIRDGDAGVMLAGASDALTEVVFAGFHAMRLLAEDACRPFAAGRRGLVLSEGAAFLVLEGVEHARKRDARPLARLTGWALTCDAAHPTTPRSDGVLRAMTAAIADAGRVAKDVAQISAHGTGSVANDAAEAEAIAGLLGHRLPRVPVSAIKETLGHTEGAAGAFAALAGVLMLQHRCLPARIGAGAPDPALPRLRLAESAAEAFTGDNVLVNASGFGGANVSLLFENPVALPPASSRTHRRTARAVVTATLALCERDGSLTEASGDVCWPGGGSLPLDRISGLVVGAAGRLLAPRQALADESAAVALGTTYGSQARHEAMWSALTPDGPRALDPNDFALSTFNAPGAAVAAAHGCGGANLIYLGGTAGVAAIHDAARIVTAGRAHSVLSGAYEEVTPYFRRLLRSAGEPGVAEAVVLLKVEDAEDADRTGATAASILASANKAPAARWACPAEFEQVLRATLSDGPIAAAVILDPHRNTRQAQLAALEAVVGAGVTLIDLAQRYGNCLAAATPLAVHVAVQAARNGSWPAETVLRGDAAFDSDRPVLILASGLLSGCAALLVMPHGR